MEKFLRYTLPSPEIWLFFMMHFVVKETVTKQIIPSLDLLLYLTRKSLGEKNTKNEKKKLSIFTNLESNFRAQIQIIHFYCDNTG